MSFASDMEKFIEKTKRKAEDIVIASCIAVSNEIIDRTPVDSGRLRGNWIPSINAPKITETDNIVPLKTEVQGEALKAYGNEFYLVNSLPYVRRIEYTGWSKVKAPQGMVRISVQNFQNHIKRAIQ